MTGVDRGFVFVCFNASIWRQFETVQALWIDDGDPFGLGPDKDFLAGEPHGTRGEMTIQGRPPFFLKPQPRLVTMRGGEYLSRPSMTGPAPAHGRMKAWTPWQLRNRWPPGEYFHANGRP
jgi:hypothetical protein